MKLFCTLLVLALISFNAFCQQWVGVNNTVVNNTTDQILRTGRVGIGGILLGRYGAAISGDSNPYFISSDETHDLLVFGSSAATLHFRLFDGDLKMGPNAAANSTFYNTGNLFLGGTVGDRLVLNGDGLLNLRVGRWATLGETGGGIATLIGSNIKASTATNNKMEVISTTTDGARAIKMQYNEGISFHTYQGSVTSGADFTGYERMRIDVNGNVGVGTIPNAKLDIVNGSQRIKFLTGTSSSGYELNIGVNDDGVNFYNNSSIRGYKFSNINGTHLTITQEGNIGIGTGHPDQKLTVLGSIHSKEVIVDVDIVPDYVFEPTYNLPTLKDDARRARPGHAARRRRG